MVDFTDILNKKAVDTEEPKPQPVGTYLGAIQSLPEQRTVDTKEGERAVLRFKMKAIQAKEDVDPERLAECGDVTSWPPFNHDLWIDTPAGEYALQQFLQNTIGLSLTNGKEKKSYSELLPECVGKQVVFTVVHKMGMRDNKPVIFVNVGTVAHV